ncbi:hypothetical protein GCM10027162_08220 [Streptomyces incanus]
MWRPEMGERQLARRANEGGGSAACCGLCTRLHCPVRRPGCGTGCSPQGSLLPHREHPSDALPQRQVTRPGTNGSQAQAQTHAADGTSQLTIPLRVTLGFDTPLSSQAALFAPLPALVPTPKTPPQPPPTGRPGVVSAVERDVDAALINHRLTQERPYYDRTADFAARDAYHANVGTGDFDPPCSPEVMPVNASTVRHEPFTTIDLGRWTHTRSFAPTARTTETCPRPTPATRTSMSRFR